MLVGYKPQFHSKILDGTKKHTIRTDAHDRWHAGMIMHQSAGVRTKQYKLLRLDTCTGTQKIIIRHINNEIIVCIDDEIFYDTTSVNYAKISRMSKLAFNDGFDSIDAFFNWFNTDYIGKIIHWTDLRY